MRDALDEDLQRWQSAGLIDSDTAARISDFESKGQPPSRLRWPVIFALIFGAILLGAGVLLFVAAHWDDLSHGARFAAVLSMVALFHVAGAFCEGRFADMATALHAIGTIALGAGIFLCGQIFNMNSDWAGGLTLWSAGGWVAWAIRRDSTQLMFAALLTPIAISGEWTSRFTRPNDQHPLFLGLTVLSIVYLTALSPGSVSISRKGLSVIGSVTLIPLVIASALIGEHAANPMLLTKIITCAVPLSLAWWLRRADAWKNAVAAVAVIALGMLGEFSIAKEAWCACGAVALVAWGVNESRSILINVGTLGFAISVAFFYFTNVMDKLDRSLSLIVLGALFLAGGWALEITRRRLIAGIAGDPA